MTWNIELCTSWGQKQTKKSLRNSRIVDDSNTGLVILKHYMDVWVYMNMWLYICMHIYISK